MSRITWQDIFLTGNRTVDNQHRRLVEIINALDSDHEHGIGDNAVDGAIASLIAYANEHFVTEQGIMQSCEYPAYEEHKALHDKILVELDAMTWKIRHRGNVTCSGLLNFLADWLLDHILEEDGKFGRFCRDQKVQALSAE